MLTHDYGKEEGGWTYDDISKYFFIKWNSFETKKTITCCISLSYQ